MKKILVGGIILLTAVYSVFAGDAAAFVDLGFSSDGSTYIFAQYGKTDRTFRAWADIFTVDVASNKFVKGEVYRTLPSVSTVEESGKEAYQKLVAKNFSILDKYKCKPVSAEDVLYIFVDSTDTDKKNIITFKDFKGSTLKNPITYQIQLMPTYKGSGNNTSSSFFITVKKTDGSGKVLDSKTAGSPSIWRKGVTGYKIDRIFRNKTGNNLIFVIEKTVEDQTGVSIRYMIETLGL